MLQLRSTNDRGTTKLGWLNSRHTFSFADYYDPAQMGFGDLRVINDDIIAPKEGFAAHRNNNMEIVTVMLSGSLEYKDNMDNKNLLLPGEIQRVSAGTGVIHSEYNPSLTKPAHVLHIWIMPDRKNLLPDCELKTFPRSELFNNICLIVSQGGKKGSLHINQNINIYQMILEEARPVLFNLSMGRMIWVQIAQGSAEVNSLYLKAGDGLAITDEMGVAEIKALEDQTNILIFEMFS